MLMKVFERLILKFGRSEEFIRDEIRKNNVQRIIYFSILAIPVNLFLIIAFYFNLEEKGLMAYQWGIGIIGCHTFSLIFFLTTLILFLTYRKRGKINSRIIDLFFIFIFFIILALGIVIVTFDQMVTPAITPYLIACCIISLIILTPPIYSITLYLISYILFAIGISIFQHNPEIILSNRVNGVVAIAVGITISIILWRNMTTRYKQGRIIENQKKELEKNLSELVLKTEELQKVNESKDKLFSIIAHDLSSPFNLIAGLSAFVKENIHDYSIDQIETYLTDINKASSQTQSLLLELLTWARLQTGNIIFVPVQFKLLPECTKIIESVSSISSAKKIKIEIQMNEQLTIKADVEMTKTIIRNLVSNAIKYSYSGGKIIIRARKENSMALIEIIDHGIGISPEKIDRLFSIYDKQSTPGTDNEQGSGLGLILCKEFVEKHNGRIWVESPMDKGSRFSFTLPLSK
jgi:signal transduction histidine kinase